MIGSGVMSGIGFDYEFLRPRAAMLSPPRCQLAVPSLPSMYWIVLIVEGLMSGRRRR